VKPTAKRIVEKIESLSYVTYDSDSLIRLSDVSEIAGIPVDQIRIKIFSDDYEIHHSVEFYKVTQEEVENANFDAELVAYNEKFEAWSEKKQSYDAAMKAWN